MLQLQAIADTEVGKKSYTPKVDPEVREAIGAIHAAEPVLSNYFLTPGDDEKAQKTFLRHAKAAAALLVDEANPLGRRIIVGKHAKTGAPVWALAGPIKPRKAKVAAAGSAATAANTAANTLAEDAAAAGSEAGVRAAVKASGSKR